MKKSAEDIQKEAFEFAERFTYDELVAQLGVMNYQLAKIKEENGSLSKLYALNPVSEKSVEYHSVVAKIMEIESRLDMLGKEESKKGYSDTYGLRGIYESGQVLQIPNEDLDVDKGKMRNSIQSGGRVMAARRAKKTGMDIKFRSKKTQSMTTFWFERSENKNRFE